ncbi:ArgS-related anticodon-binding protein NrtL [Streptomyces poonensis]|uniref:ArgS-related anticodon-binding protein NrtL n=1 Tax=Streptomyces poonensis TaxID=68255 RepID=UPI001677D8A1|nr:DALR anticodon-binding domain-containing protein [Streptomyces poonensis]
MTPVELSRTVLRAVRRAVDEGELSVVVPERAVVTPPGPGGCGDYATNIALQLARPAGRPPLQVAEILRPHLSRTEGVAEVEITGPGFLNIHLADAQAAATAAVVRQVLAERERYGHSRALDGQVVRLCVPYEVRAEVVADALVRIVASQGGRAEVQHEHGEPVTLRPVPAPEDPAPLGLDAARWALLHPAGRDRPRITADHLVQRASNPLFRVRYAHARSRALLRNAADLGFGSAAEAVPDADDLVTDLVIALADYPRALTHAAIHRAPDRLARHLVTVADALLALQHTVLPRGEEKPTAAHRSRLALADAAGTVLAGGLSLLGIDAPDHL